MLKPFVSIATLASLLRSPAAAWCSAAILVGAGCSKEPGDGTPASAAAATTKGNRPDAAPAGDKGASGGAPGGRRAASIILAASDVKTVERGTIEAGVAVSGDLRAIEEAVVRARLEGDLVGVYVREGDHVKEGQLLARFEDSEQESNRTSAIADREAAQSDLETAKWNAEQSEQLFKAGAIAERDLRTAQQTLAASRARLAAAEARVRATTSLLTDTRALAPTTGVVAKRSVENGEHVARGADMFTVVRSDVLELAAAVPARQASEIRVGQRVHFAAGGRDLDGRVARINPTIDPTNRSITVYAQVPNGAGELKATRSRPAASCRGPSTARSSSQRRPSARRRAPTSRSCTASTPTTRSSARPSASALWMRARRSRRSPTDSTPAIASSSATSAPSAPA